MAASRNPYCITQHPGSKDLWMVPCNSLAPKDRGEIEVYLENQFGDVIFPQLAPGNMSCEKAGPGHLKCRAKEADPVHDCYFGASGELKCFPPELVLGELTASTHVAPDSIIIRPVSQVLQTPAVAPSLLQISAVAPPIAVLDPKPIQLKPAQQAPIILRPLPPDLAYLNPTTAVQTPTVLAEPSFLLAGSSLVLAESSPVPAETSAVLAKPLLVLAQPSPVLAEPSPVAKPLLVLTQPSPVLAEPSDHIRLVAPATVHTPVIIESAPEVTPEPSPALGSWGPSYILIPQLATMNDY